MQNNLRIKTLKPMIKDAEQNKYMLEAVKSRDLASQRLGDLFLNFGTPSITFKRKKLDTSFFSLLDRPSRVLHSG